MPINFTALKRTPRSKRSIDPIELFQSATVTDPTINDLWLSQGDALRQWHAHRNLHDIAITLNTGAGKTLIGLFAAQSITNETKGSVFYVCSTNQLVNQTVQKAKGYGLNVTAYMEGTFSNNLYHEGLAPCITTYHALFNGKSRFFNQQIEAIIFDDAHTAENILRDQFTLTISRKLFESLYLEIGILFRGYFARLGSDVGYYEALKNGNSFKSWFIPPFALYEQIGEIRRLLVNANLDGSKETMFAWEHLKDHIDLCTLFLSGTEITFSPPIIPVLTLPYFKKKIRRLYLSATLVANDSFLRTFGREPDLIIKPETTAGECERLIIIPRLNVKGRDDVTTAKDIIKKHKALVLVPSFRQAKTWGESLETIETFKEATLPVRLILASRYDGIDFPGDTCRVMVIDELCIGLNPLERFFWEQLGFNANLQSTIASRIIQSFGRISRGMSDHGVVILTGKNLIEWLLRPANRSLLPRFLTKQIELGIELSKEIVSLEDMADSVDQCLNRDPNWISYYHEKMDTIDESQEKAETRDIPLAISRAEIAFGHELWARNYQDAAKYLEKDLDTIFASNKGVGAWHRLWIGYSYLLLKDNKNAQIQFDLAHRLVNALPACIPTNPDAETDKIPSQIIEMTSNIKNYMALGDEFLSHVDRDLRYLDGTGSAPQTEEALRSLGQYFGLQSSRPDSEFKTGPDVFWDSPTGYALCMEVKSNKTTVYRKQDLGQMHDHRQWTLEHSSAHEIYLVFVGPVLPCSPEANPSSNLVIIEILQFYELGQRLRAAIVDILQQSVPATLAKISLKIITERGLLWPQAYNNLRKNRLTH